MQTAARIAQQLVELLYRGARVVDQTAAGRFARFAARAEHLLIGIGHQAIQALGQLVGPAQHPVGPVDRGHDFPGIGLIAKQHPHGPLRTLEGGGHCFQVRQAFLQRRPLARQAIEVVQQIAHLGQQFGKLRRCIAAQHLAHRAFFQRGVRQHTAVGPDFGAPHQRLLHGEDAGAAQPFGVFGGHIHQDAHIAVFGQFDARHGTDGKPGKGHVHARDHTFGVVRHEHQPLGALKNTAGVHHIERRAHQQGQQQEQQNTRLELQVFHRRLRIKNRAGRRCGRCGHRDQ